MAAYDEIKGRLGKDIMAFESVVSSEIRVEGEEGEKASNLLKDINAARKIDSDILEKSKQLQFSIDAFKNNPIGQAAAGTRDKIDAQITEIKRLLKEKEEIEKRISRDQRAVYDRFVRSHKDAVQGLSLISDLFYTAHQKVA